jgi:hypothetical protein
MPHAKLCANALDDSSKRRIPRGISECHAGRLDFPSVSDLLVHQGLVAVAVRCLFGTLDYRLGVAFAQWKSNEAETFNLQARIRSLWTGATVRIRSFEVEVVFQSVLEVRLIHPVGMSKSRLERVNLRVDHRLQTNQTRRLRLRHHFQLRRGLAGRLPSGPPCAMLAIAGSHIEGLVSSR